MKIQYLKNVYRSTLQLLILIFCLLLANSDISSSIHKPRKKPFRKFYKLRAYIRGSLQYCIGPVSFHYEFSPSYVLKSEFKTPQQDRIILPKNKTKQNPSQISTNLYQWWQNFRLIFRVHHAYF